jgi:predicted RNA binding protein with dsRBD fold (UPF0201 family)
MATNIISTDSTTDDDIPTIGTIYQGWLQGDLQTQEALNMLCHFIGQSQDVIEPIEINIKLARGYASEMVDWLGGKAEAPGFGKLEITSPSITYSYDKKLLDNLNKQLRTEGLGDVAARLDSCLKPSERAGSLRITRTKEA